MPIISLNCWTLAYNWKKNAKIVQDKSNLSTYYIQTTENDLEFNIAEIEAYKLVMENKNFNSFEHFVSSYNKDGLIA